jgi:ferritin
MTPKLLTNINAVISGELTMSAMELNEMNHCHEMGFQGFKRFHRFYAMDRQRHALMLSNFVVEYHHVTPVISVSYNSANTTSSSLLEAMQRMHDLSVNHLELLKSTAKMAIDEGEDLLMGMLEKLLRDESCEVARYYREVKDLTYTNSDRSYVLLRSDKLHTKYKDKEKEYFNYQDKG